MVVKPDRPSVLIGVYQWFKEPGCRPNRPAGAVRIGLDPFRWFPIAFSGHGIVSKSCWSLKPVTNYKLNSAKNRQFWEANAATYQGVKNASTLIFLTRQFLGQKILDAGAGDGSLVRELKRHRPTAEVIGVDLAPKSEDVEQGDLTALRFADAAFDTVISSEVIEHLTPEDSRRALGEVSRVLKPGGCLILTTPYAEELHQNQVFCPDCRQSFHRWGHQQSFREADFAVLAREHGLQSIEILPIRYSRVRRLRFLGTRILKLRWMRALFSGGPGRRNLLMIARKRLVIARKRAA